jgi:uncharacterized membrane protein YgcG
MVPTNLVAAASVHVPWWTWATLIVLILVLMAVTMFMATSSRKQKRARSARRAGKGLSAEQQAFQLEMQLTLQRRLYEKQALLADPMRAEGRAGSRGAGGSDGKKPSSGGGGGPPGGYGGR